MILKAIRTIILKPLRFIYKKIIQWLMKDTSPKRPYLCDFEKITYEVKPADILLIEGQNRVSGIIQQLTHSPWSHAAMYIGRLSDISDIHLRKLIKNKFPELTQEQLVIESQLGSGTIVSPLSKYIDDHIRICRPKGITPTDIKKVIKYSLTHLGTKYSVRHILDLARLLLPMSIIPRRLKSTLFTLRAGKPTEEICSTLIAEAFASVKFPILPHISFSEQKGYELMRRNPKLLTPSNFDYSPYFDIIKYPIFDIEHRGTYHNLPWSEKVLIDEENQITSEHSKSADTKKPTPKTPPKEN